MSFQDVFGTSSTYNGDTSVSIITQFEEKGIVPIPMKTSLSHKIQRVRHKMLVVFEIFASLFFNELSVDGIELGSSLYTL